MNNLTILPIILPVIAGMIMVVFRNQIRMHRALSLGTLTLIGIVAVMLMEQIQQNGIQVLHVGGWHAPFGISMVADMFSVLLVFTNAVVAFCCIWYAFFSIGEEREKHFFIPSPYS
jgi:multicomponent Na+:H+ antiporter subunit D